MAAAVVVEERAGLVAPGAEAPFTCSLEVEYPSERAASIVRATLAVDAELQPDKVKREISTRGHRLVVSFTATEARFLRASLSAFLDIVALASKAIEEFGQSI